VGFAMVLFGVHPGILRLVPPSSPLAVSLLRPRVAEVYTGRYFKDGDPHKWMTLDNVLMKTKCGNTLDFIIRFKERN